MGWMTYPFCSVGESAAVRHVNFVRNSIVKEQMNGYGCNERVYLLRNYEKRSVG